MKMSSTFGEPMAAVMIQFAKKVTMEKNATTVQISFTQKMVQTKKLTLTLEKEIFA